MHDVPKPRIGGIAVFFGFAFALFAVLGFALASPYALLPSALQSRTPSRSRFSPTSSRRSTSSSGCSSAAC